MGACGAGCGITRERDREKEAALEAIQRAYPGGIWSSARRGPDLALHPDAIRDLGESLESLLPVRAIPRLAGGEGCDWLYLLAGLHRPSLVELCDRTGLPADEPLHAAETSVRIGFSPLGPFVTLQEVVVRAEGDELVEEPALGIQDRRLQAIVKGLQGALRKARLVVLDMAFLVEPGTPTGAPSPGREEQPEFWARYDDLPTRWSFLFEGTPPLTPRATLLPAPA